MAFASCKMEGWTTNIWNAVEERDWTRPSWCAHLVARHASGYVMGVMTTLLLYHEERTKPSESHQDNSGYRLQLPVSLDQKHFPASLWSRCPADKSSLLEISCKRNAASVFSLEQESNYRVSSSCSALWWKPGLCKSGTQEESETIKTIAPAGQTTAINLIYLIIRFISAAVCHSCCLLFDKQLFQEAHRVQQVQ